jgi:GT2 family glycosyltransferase
MEGDLSNITILVVDNGSANNEAARLAELFPGISVLPQKENTGFCGGNNIGIQRALEDGAELILLLNNDTIIPKDAVKILAEEFIKLPDAGAICPIILLYPETEFANFVKASWDAKSAQFSLNSENKKYGELKNKKPWKSEFANGCCLLTSSEVIKKVGLLDERYFAYYDEADWCRRLEKAGYFSYVSPAAFIYHVKYTLSHSRISMYLLTRNRLLWIKENLSFRERSKSFLYLKREFFWHLLNVVGLVKGDYTHDLSRAYLMGWRDFKLKRFGRWKNKYEDFFVRK